MNEQDKSLVETTHEETSKNKRVKNTAAGHEIPAREVITLSEREVRKKTAKEKWEKDKTHKSKMVTGKFLFNECPGGELRFTYREFPGDPRVTYIMKHDTIHTIPLGVAMHLNDRCAYAEFQHNLEGGKLIDGQNLYIQSKVHRTNFIPLDWSVDVGNTTGRSIVQATYHNPLDNRYNLDAEGR